MNLGLTNWAIIIAGTIYVDLFPFVYKQYVHYWIIHLEVCEHKPEEHVYSEHDLAAQQGYTNKREYKRLVFYPANATTLNRRQYATIKKRLSVPLGRSLTRFPFMKQLQCRSLVLGHLPKYKWTISPTPFPPNNVEFWWSNAHLHKKKYLPTLGGGGGGERGDYPQIMPLKITIVVQNYSLVIFWTVFTVSRLLKTSIVGAWWLQSNLY